MKFLIVFVSTFMVCIARPQIISFQPTFFSSWPVFSANVPSVSQYHSQDALGQYSYGYAGGPSAKSEVKTLDGVTRGSYSYIDADSKLRTVNYVADSLGFRVATNLPTPSPAQAPTPVDDTAEVKQARAEHLAAVSKARSENPEQESEELVAPETVEDTEEVKQARSEHLRAVEEAKARSSTSITVAEPQLIQAQDQAVLHLAHSPASAVVQLVQAPAPATFHLAHAPVAILRSDPATSFAYSVLAA